MDSTVSRYEVVEKDGKTEIFINIETFDDLGDISNFAKWLSPSEVEQIQADSTGATKDTILAKYIAIGQRRAAAAGMKAVKPTN